MTAADEVALGTEDTGDVLAEVESLIGDLNSHPDPRVGETTMALLNRIDAVHRAALTHLIGAIQSMAGEAFMNRLSSDPAIRLLLMSYDLLAVDRRTLAEEALDAVRGHLHAHGVDVELVEVLGGVVAVRLHGPPVGHPALEGARRDVEEALRANFLGFQELEITDGKGARVAATDSVFLPIESLRRAKRPVYLPVLRAAEVASGTTKSVVVNGSAVLLVHAGDEFFALHNACGESPLPLEYSTLEGTVLQCSWHGCRYDVRTGHRVDLEDARHADSLRVLPVRVQDGMIEVVVGTTAAVSDA